MTFKTACVVTVGSEITRGLIQDTNSQWLTSRLSNRGLTVKRIISVPDEEGEIAWAVKNCLEVADLVIITGGLGFTSDDITIQAVARALGLKLVLSIEALEMIKSKIRGDIGYRVKAAYIPEGSRPLYNRAGISPGVHISLDSKHIFILPGVPGEMKTVFEDHVAPLLATGYMYSKILVIKTKHSIESLVDRLLMPLRVKYTWAYFKTHAKTPVEVVVVIQASSPLELTERTRILISDLARTILLESIEQLD